MVFLTSVEGKRFNVGSLRVVPRITMSSWLKNVTNAAMIFAPTGYKVLL